MSNENKLVSFLEGVVILAIVLVLIQTFIQDLATVYQWDWQARKTLLYIGFGFDLFFTIEFLTRFYFALLDRRAGRYFFSERGWVDFLASIPLLLLNSGPLVLALAAGGVSVASVGGMMNVLKVVKAIRIARILRLLRVLKIFQRIRHAESPMAQRHVAKVATVTVSIGIFAVLVFAFVAAFVNMPGLESGTSEHNLKVAEYIRDQNLTAPASRERLAAFAGAESSLLMVKENARTLYSRYEPVYYEKNFGFTDYGYVRSGDTGYYFDIRPINADQSRQNLVYFSIIVAIVLALLLYYGPHFAMTISDPIHVMRRGFAEKSYNLEVKVPERYGEDDVYRLGALYNDVFLPLKARSEGQDDSGIVDLSMDDVRGMLGEEGEPAGETGSEGEEPSEGFSLDDEDAEENPWDSNP